jgi:hypothetical protein
MTKTKKPSTRAPSGRNAPEAKRTRREIGAGRAGLLESWPGLVQASPGDPLFKEWAQALQEAGDPRGELVTLSRKFHETPTTELKGQLSELIAKNPKWTRDTAPFYEATFRDGFISGLRCVAFDTDFELDDEDKLEDVYEPKLLILRDPISSRLERLSLGTLIYAEGNHGCWGRQKIALRNLLSMPRPHLRTLEFDCWMMTEPLNVETGEARLPHRLRGCMHEAEITYGDLSQLWKIAPQLEHLVIAQGLAGKLQGSLGDIDAPRLRTLCLGFTPIVATQLEALSAAKLPNLRWLELRLVSDDIGVANERLNAQLLKAALNNSTLRQLHHIALLGDIGQEAGLGREDGELVISTFLESPLLGQVKSLDLGGIQAGDSAWQKLIAFASRLSLKELRLTRNIPPVIAGGLEAAFPVIWRSPEAMEPTDPTDPNQERM